MEATIRKDDDRHITLILDGRLDTSVTPQTEKEVEPLFDYKDYRDSYDMEKAYLQGRFDAVPYIAMQNIG